MIRTDLQFNVFCDKQGKMKKDPIYRVYVDNELITERSYIWNEEHYLRENVPLFLEPGRHILKIEDVIGSSNAQFRINKVTLNGKPYELINGEEFVL